MARINWHRLLLLPPRPLSSEEWVRILIHIPHGLLIAWWAFGWPIPVLVDISPSLFSVITAALLALTFVTYQFIQEWHEHDNSRQDIAGICWGFGILGSILGILWGVL